MKYTEHPGELEAIRQNVDWVDVRDAYAGAYRGVFGDSIRSAPLAILLAHSALETGRWKKGLWNWNLGNIKSSESYANKPGNYHQFYRLNEYLKQPDGSMRYVWFDPTHPQTRMRAYRTSANGAAEKIRFLGTASNPARGNRYQRAWDALEGGDASAFSKELHSAGYYTAQEPPYTRAVVSLFNEFLENLGDAPIPDEPVISAPLVPDDYDPDLPLHSGPTDEDVDLWLGDPEWGLPAETIAAIEQMKLRSYLDLNDQWD